MKEVMEPAGIVRAGLRVIRMETVRVETVAGTHAAVTVIKPGGVDNLLLEDGGNLLLESTGGVLLLE